jgi:hypothetical protein
MKTTPSPSAASLLIRKVDGALRAHVDSARRLVGEQHLRRLHEPLRDRGLLLVAAGERGDGHRVAGGARVDVAEHGLDASTLAAELDDSVPAHLGQVRHAHVLAHGADHHQSLVPPALR